MKQEKMFIPDEIVGEIEVKGKKYVVKQGAKGGKYYINAKGKKTYVKEKKEKPKTIKIEKTIFVGKAKERLKRFYCKIYDLDEDGYSLGDGCNEWHDAYTEEEAYDYWESEYPNRSQIKGTLLIYNWEYVDED